MITRSLRILTQPFLKNRINANTLKLARNTWVYRELSPSAPKWELVVADGLNAFTWWWIFIHIYYQPGHILGEYDYPKPSKWSDAELGVVDFD